MSESELKVGAVIDGRGGKKYVYTGGDRYSKDSYKPFNPPTAFETEKPSPPGPMDYLDRLNQVAGNMVQFNPMYQLAKRVSEPASAIGEALEKGAYDVGGKVTDVGAELGLPPEVAGGAGYVANVATQAVPSILSGTAIKSAASPLLRGAGKYFMQSAVKPSAQNLASGKAAQAVQTLLDEGVNVTPGGVAKLGSEVSALYNQVDELIAAADKAGVTVNKSAAASRVKDALERFRYQVDSGADLETIKNTWQAFLKSPELKDLDDLPVALAQKIKRGTYSILGSKPYGELKGAEVEAQKAIARGLKEEIENVVPGVVAPNKRQAELLNALEVIEPRVNMSGNKNIGGLAYLAENPAAAGAFLLDRSEIIKSLLGRFLHNAAPGILGNTARVGVGGVMTQTANE